MKVLHIIDGCSGLYGAEIILLNLINEQLKMNLQTILLGVGSLDERIKPIEEEVRKKGVLVETLRTGRRISLKDAKYIINFAHDQDVDIIHSHSYKTDIILGLLPRHLRKNIAIISTVHGWLAIKKFTKLWVYKIVNIICLMRMDAVVEVRQPSKNIMTTLNRNEYVVENGINYDNRDKNIDDDELEKIVSFKEKHFCICAIGRLSPEKGFIYLIDALKKVKESEIRCKLVLFGDGIQKVELNKLVKLNNLQEDVLLVGYVDNASKYMVYFDLLIIPSLTEGLPVTLLEAMQCCVPVIATEVGGIPEVLGSGKYGYLVKPRNSDELAERIAFIYHNPKLAKATVIDAQNYVVERYNSKRMASEYSRVYERVIKNKQTISSSNY